MNEYIFVESCFPFFTLFLMRVYVEKKKSGKFLGNDHKLRYLSIWLKCFSSAKAEDGEYQEMLVQSVSQLETIRNAIISRVSLDYKF